MPLFQCTKTTSLFLGAAGGASHSIENRFDSPILAWGYSRCSERVCARLAHKALSAKLNRSDKADAEGLMQLARTGW